MSYPLRRFWQLPWLALTVFPVGCGEGPADRIDPFQVSDSAGIEILHSAAPALQGENAWSVSPDPVLQIGELEGDAPFLFSSIWGASETLDGRIVVSEGQSYEIRVYSPAGEFLGSFGGRGEGPEEFGGPPWIRAAAQDTIVVWDPGHYRLSWFDLDGHLLRQVPLRSVIADQDISRFVNGLVWAIRPDGTLLSTGPGDFGMGPGLQESTRRLVLIGEAGGVVHDFGGFPSGQNLRVRRSDGRGYGVGNPFAPVIAPALGSDPYPVVVSGEGPWELRFMGATGELRRLVRADIPQIPVTREVQEAVRALATERVPGSGLTSGQFEEALSSFPVPDSLQAIGRVHVDGFGNAWVGRRTVDRRVVLDYDVFSPEGRWLTSVRMPPEIERILEVGREHLLGSWRDEFDVPYLRIYGIQKPGSGR